MREATQYNTIEEYCNRLLNAKTEAEVEAIKMEFNYTLQGYGLDEETIQAYYNLAEDMMAMTPPGQPVTETYSEVKQPAPVPKETKNTKIDPTGPVIFFSSASILVALLIASIRKASIKMRPSASLNTAGPIPPAKGPEYDPYNPNLTGDTWNANRFNEIEPKVAEYFGVNKKLVYQARDVTIGNCGDELVEDEIDGRPVLKMGNLLIFSNGENHLMITSSQPTLPLGFENEQGSNIVELRNRQTEYLYAPEADMILKRSIEMNGPVNFANEPVEYVRPNGTKFEHSAKQTISIVDGPETIEQLGDVTRLDGIIDYRELLNPATGEITSEVFTHAANLATAEKLGNSLK